MKKILIILCICTLILTGCASSESHYYYGEVDVVELTKPKDVITVKSVTRETNYSHKNLALYENKLFYSERNKGIEEFYLLDFETGLIELIGGVYGTAVRTPDMALINDTLYFYHDLPEDNDSLINVLYAFDFSNSKMSLLSKNKYTKHRIPLAGIDNKLYALQGVKGDNPYGNKDKYAKVETGVSMAYSHFLQMIDQDGKATEISLKQDDIGIPGKNAVQSGQHQILYIDNDAENILALEGIDAEGTTRYYFAKYTPDNICVYVQDISSIFKDYAITTRVESFHAFGNYFFLTDVYENVILCRCEDNEVDELICDSNLRYADNHCKNGEFEHFYMLGTNDIFRLDLQTGELEKKDYRFDEEKYVVYSMLAYDNMLLVSKQVDEEDIKEMLYLISVE